MQDYNDYVTAINKIFDYVSKMKAGWNNTDNYANIEKIDDFKSLVANCADDFKKPAKEVVEEMEEEQAPATVSETTSSRDELSFPEPVVMETERKPMSEEKPEEYDPKNGPVEIKSELPKIDTKQDFSLPPINLPNETIIPNQPSAPSLNKLDTSNIPTLDEGGN